MTVTLSEILRLPVLRGSRVVAARRRIDNAVRWCHVSEVLDIARLLSGGELLLSTGLALDVSPAQQAAYIRELHGSGVAGLMLELGRKFDAPPVPLVKAAEEVGLPLITLPFDTPFVKVTEAVHTLVLSRQGLPTPGPDHARAEGRLLADLCAGKLADGAELKRRLEQVGRTLPEPAWFGVMTVGASAVPETVRAAAAVELGSAAWLYRQQGGEGVLVAFLSDRRVLVKSLRTLANRLAPVPAGAGQCYGTAKEIVLSLGEARQTMRLRQFRPALSPLFAETGVYGLAIGHGPGAARAFVEEWLGPLLEYDRTHQSTLCDTLRLVLDDRLVIAEAARDLHLTRQGLYHRQVKIARVLGRDLDDPEVRLALAVALRFHEAQQCTEPPDESDSKKA